MINPSRPRLRVVDRATRATWLTATLAVGLATALAGCGGSETRHASADAGKVALLYSQALFAGRFSQAGRYVAPSSRNAVSVLTAGLSHASVSSHNLAVGSTHVTGASALAILTGTVCSSVGTTSRQSCVSNSDARTDNPVFRVQLTRQASGQWLVSFRRASSTASAVSKQPSETSTTTAAPSTTATP